MKRTCSFNLKTNEDGLREGHVTKTASAELVSALKLLASWGDRSDDEIDTSCAIYVDMHKATQKFIKAVAKYRTAYESTPRRHR